MAPQIRILPPSETLVRDQSVTIPIQLVLDQPLKVRGIHARFFGAEETKATYTTTSTDSKGNVRTQHHTAVQHHAIVEQSWILQGHERKGVLGNMSDAVATMFGGGQHQVLAAGEYPFEVTIAIPTDAPATHTGQKTRVFYELTVSVDVPLARDLSAQQSLSVARATAEALDIDSVRVQYPGEAGRGFIDKMFGPDVRIDLALAADHYTLGETIEGMFRIDVPDRVACRAIRARLVGIETTQAHGHRDSYTHQGAAVDIAHPGELIASFQQEFSLPAQAAGPLSAVGKWFSIDWYVQVELDVPWAKDPTIRVPIHLLPEGQ